MVFVSFQKRYAQNEAYDIYKKYIYPKIELWSKSMSNLVFLLDNRVPSAAKIVETLAETGKKPPFEAKK